MRLQSTTDAFIFKLGYFGHKIRKTRALTRIS